jgi:tetratricopeptide (TPR) repeat protein
VAGAGLSAEQVWFQAMKAHCNAVEVEVAMRQQPAPATTQGAGYAASCWALAGRIDRAREVIDALPESQRTHAAGILFDVGHPVADMGDDAAAGPIMRLVVQYQPDNYMALYHAGISYYQLGDHDLAREHLQRFLVLYPPRDGWRSNAEDVLNKIGRRVER